MRAALLMTIAWPAFLAACGLQLLVFAFVDPLELQWSGQPLAWSRQAVYSGAFFVFWAAAAVSSALTALLGLRSAKPPGSAPAPGAPAREQEPGG
jgi:hypothetical protein